MGNISSNGLPARSHRGDESQLFEDALREPIGDPQAQSGNKDQVTNKVYSDEKKHETRAFHHPFLEKDWITEEEWKLLDNYRKEDMQVAVIYLRFWELTINHKSLELLLHLRPREGRTSDIDLLILKDKKVKEHIELSHFGRKSWRNVESRLNPTIESLAIAAQESNIEIAKDFQSHYIQNGGICNDYLIEACKKWKWNLHYCPHRIYKMTRTERKQLFKLLKRIVRHALREPRNMEMEYVYAQRVDYTIIHYPSRFFLQSSSNLLSPLLLDRPPPFRHPLSLVRRRYVTAPCRCSNFMMADDLTGYKI